jgi:hypothetical protein
MFRERACRREVSRVKKFMPLRRLSRQHLPWWFFTKIASKEKGILLA